MWLITNKALNSKERSRFLSFRNYSLMASIPVYESPNTQNNWIIDGFVLSRYDEKMDFDSPGEHKILDSFSEKYGNDFIKYIKGNHTIICFDPDGFKIFSDRFAIKKFFIYKTNSEFIISDDLKEIASRIKLTPCSKRMVLYSLNYHFTGGKTIFSQVEHNQPGEIITFNGQKIKTDRYWYPEYLLNAGKTDITINSLVDRIKSVVNATLSNNKRISLSLTGGSDTRNLLAVFLSQGIKPHVYTYGNPKSNDCIKASKIARGLKLHHRIHEIEMDPETFSRRARDIIRLGGGLISIHRVHRLIAIEKEHEFADYMYLGSLGGEFIKGVTEDNYIIPAIVFMNWNNEKLTPEGLHKFLMSKNLRFPAEIAEDVLNMINSEPFMQGNLVHRKLNSLCYITAHLHDAQDINLYRSVMEEIYPPFLDIDYLETLFMSIYSFDNKENLANKKLMKLENPVFASHFLRSVYPPLLEFKYSGEHKPSEVLFSKYYAALVKIIRQKTIRKYPPNFPLGNWMKDFVKQNLTACYDFNILKDTYNLDQLMKDLVTSEHLPVESYWLKYTNPIMMRFIIEEFINV